MIVGYSLNFCIFTVAAFGIRSCSLEELLISSSLSYAEVLEASEHVGFNGKETSCVGIVWGSRLRWIKPTHFDFFWMVTKVITADVLYLQHTDNVWSVVLGVSVTQSGEPGFFVRLWLFYEGSQ